MNQDNAQVPTPTRWQTQWRQQLDRALQEQPTGLCVTVEFRLQTDRTLTNARLRASRRQAPLHQVTVSPLECSVNGDTVNIMYIVHGLPGNIRMYLDAVDEDLNSPGVRSRRI
jgi:hypothetical protein